jgi:hypothetical protein
VVSDLQKLSQALSKDTPEKVAEQEIKQRAPEIERALQRDGVYYDSALRVRISADVNRR